MAHDEQHPNWELLAYYEKVTRYLYLTPGNRPSPDKFLHWTEVYGPAARRIAKDLQDLGVRVRSPDEIPLDLPNGASPPACPLGTNPVKIANALLPYLRRTDANAVFENAVSKQLKDLINGLMTSFKSKKYFNETVQPVEKKKLDGTMIQTYLRKFRNAQNVNYLHDPETVRRDALGCVFRWVDVVLQPVHEGSIEYYRHVGIKSLRRRWYRGSNEDLATVAIVDCPNDGTSLARWIAHRIHDAAHAHHFLHMGIEPEWQKPIDLMRLEGTAMAAEHEVRTALRAPNKAGALANLIRNDLVELQKKVSGGMTLLYKGLAELIHVELQEALLSRTLRAWYDFDTANKDCGHETWLTKAGALVGSEYAEEQILATGGIPGYGISYLAGAAACALDPTLKLAHLDESPSLEVTLKSDRLGQSGRAHRDRTDATSANADAGRLRLNTCVTAAQREMINTPTRDTDLLCPTYFWLRRPQKQMPYKQTDKVISDGLHFNAVINNSANFVALEIPPLAVAPLTPMKPRNLEDLTRADRRVLSIISRSLSAGDTHRRFVFWGDAKVRASAADTLIRYLDTRTLYSALYINIRHHDSIEGVLYDFGQQISFVEAPTKPLQPKIEFKRCQVPAFLGQVKKAVESSTREFCFIVDGLSEVDSLASWKQPAGHAIELDRLAEIFNHPCMGNAAVVLLADHSTLLDSDTWTVAEVGTSLPTDNTTIPSMILDKALDVTSASAICALGAKFNREGLKATLTPIWSMAEPVINLRLRTAHAALRISKSQSFDISKSYDRIIEELFKELFASDDANHTQSAILLAMASTRVDGLSFADMEIYHRAAQWIEMHGTLASLGTASSGKLPALADMLLDTLSVKDDAGTSHEYLELHPALAVDIERIIQSRSENPEQGISGFTLHVAAAALALRDAQTVLNNDIALGDTDINPRARMRYMSAIRHIGLALQAHPPSEFRDVPENLKDFHDEMLCVADIDGSLWPAPQTDHDQLATNLLGLADWLFERIDHDQRISAILGLSRARLEVLIPFFKRNAEEFGYLFKSDRLGPCKHVIRIGIALTERFCNSVRDICDWDLLQQAECWAEGQNVNKWSSGLREVVLARAASLLRQQGKFEAAETRLKKIAIPESRDGKPMTLFQRDLKWIKALNCNENEAPTFAQYFLNDCHLVGNGKLNDRAPLAALCTNLSVLGCLLGRYQKPIGSHTPLASEGAWSRLLDLFTHLNADIEKVSPDLLAYRLGCMSRIIRTINCVGSHMPGVVISKADSPAWLSWGDHILKSLGEFILEKDCGVQMRRQLYRELAIACIHRLHVEHTRHISPKIVEPSIGAEISHYWLALFCKYVPNSAGPVIGLEHELLQHQARTLLKLYAFRCKKDFDVHCPKSRQSALNEALVTIKSSKYSILSSHASRLIRWKYDMFPATNRNGFTLNLPLPPCAFGVF